MWRAYRDMKEANYKGADKYFHARPGNYDAAQRGPGGVWAAKVISGTRGPLGMQGWVSRAWLPGQPGGPRKPWRVSYRLWALLLLSTLLLCAQCEV